MILYLTTCGLALTALFLIILRINGAIFYTQITFWIFGIVGIVSVLYLESSQVYIIEQFQTSFANGASIVLILLFFFHAAGILFGQKAYARKIITLQTPRQPQHAKKNIATTFFLLVSAALVSVLHLNLIVSSTPPFFSEGYIDRFSYLETTTLWPVLSIFGAVTVPVPIMLGWLASHSKYKALTYVLLALYLAYLAFIGQKFGGFLLGIFLFLLPTIVKLTVTKNARHYIRPIIVWSSVIGCITILPVLYHYSRYSLSDEFGGPLGLVIYRIFGLTGHTFWGSFNLFIQEPINHFAPSNLYNGMQNIMRLIAPTIADDMIERGVNFTFGYFASNLLYLSILAPFFLVLFGLIQFFLSYYLTSFVINEKPIEYFCLANLLVSVNGFYGQGSLSYALNFKTLLVVTTLILVIFIKKAVRQRSKLRSRRMKTATERINIQQRAAGDE